MNNRAKLRMIAEIGMSHDGSFGNASRLIDMAAECGADLVKFQLHISEAETLRSAPPPPYFSSEPRYEYFERTAFSAEQWQKLKARCAEKKVGFLCSPFSAEAVERLERLGVSAYKIPSGEVTNHPLLELIASTGKEVLLSSGMSSWKELDAAVEIFKKRRNRLTVFQCTSAYPCPYEEVGLNLLGEMRKRYEVEVGLSDHTLDEFASLAAAALGASAIERHVTFSRKMYGSDPAHSLEPSEFARLCAGVRAIETMLASPVDKDRMAGKLAGMKRTFEKSVVSLADIPKGAILTRELIGVKKPGGGIPASRYGDLMGRRSRKAIPAGKALKEEDLER
ncbi:MAG: N-acetylneuraminate synthase family protein [Elusimicrobia bacterium]|nr:N-acetylneuraminate synthase family protein [Elusimicrobiota bacterium]